MPTERQARTGAYTDHVVLSTDDVADLNVRDGRHDAVASLVNKDHHSTWPSLAVEAEF